jgi:hypothetical protein
MLKMMMMIKSLLKIICTTKSRQDSFLGGHMTRTLMYKLVKMDQQFDYKQTVQGVAGGT